MVLWSTDGFIKVISSWPNFANVQYKTCDVQNLFFTLSFSGDGSGSNGRNRETSERKTGNWGRWGILDFSTLSVLIVNTDNQLQFGFFNTSYSYFKSFHRKIRDYLTEHFWNRNFWKIRGQNFTVEELDNLILPQQASTEQETFDNFKKKSPKFYQSWWLVIFLKNPQKKSTKFPPKTSCQWCLVNIDLLICSTQSRMNWIANEINL